MEDATKVQLEERIKLEKRKLEETQDNLEYDNGIREGIRKQIANSSTSWTGSKV